MRRKPAPAKPADSRTVDQKASREEQFETVFLKNWQHVYHLLLNLVGSPAEAEDLALETFVRLNEHSSDPVVEANPTGWLRRVAVNLGLDEIRRWKRRERYEMESGKASLEEDWIDSPSELLMQKEQRLFVRRILAEMKLRSAQLLILRYSGLSYQEIAVIMGVAPTSVGPLLLRAEKEFKQHYHAADLEESR